LGPSLRAVLKTELTHLASDSLLRFAIRCGASQFTVRSSLGDIELVREQLSSFFIGQRKREIPCDGTRRQFERVPVWNFDELSISAILTLCPGGLRAHKFTWVFYKPSGICLVARPGLGIVYMSLTSDQSAELLRLGFLFTWVLPDGTPYEQKFVEIVPADGSPEESTDRSQRPANIPPTTPKTVDELFNSPYGVMSFPPSWGYPRINLGATDNPHILSWWSRAHDELLARQIARDGWNWWPSTSALSSMTDGDVFDQWQIDDPKCFNGNWATVLAEFSRARAQQQGLAADVKWPSDARQCEVCADTFSPSAHPPKISKVSSLSYRYCCACIFESFGQGSEHASREECLSYVQKRSELLGRVPSSGFARDWPDFAALDDENATAVLRLLKTKPSQDRIKDHFGSWLSALISAGVLQDGTRRTMRGTQCLARDGHVCLSIVEKTIDDLLSDMGIPHEKEVRYPGSQYKCDFKAKGIYIEYFGLTGNPEYDAKTKEKLALAVRLGIAILPLYPEDVVNQSALRKKLEDKFRCRPG